VAAPKSERVGEATPVFSNPKVKLYFSSLVSCPVAYGNRATKRLHTNLFRVKIRKKVPQDPFIFLYFF
jgi:hypothetical protein